MPQANNPEGGVKPLPLRFTVTGDAEASLTIEMLPVSLATDLGANATLRLLDCPGPSASGKMSPLTLKSEPITCGGETVTAPLPELLSVTIWVLILPTTTLPKSMLVRLTLHWPVPEGGGGVPVVVAVCETEPHAVSESQERKASSRARLFLHRNFSFKELWFVHGQVDFHLKRTSFRRARRCFPIEW